jgi:lipoprotein-releasing system permease protein
MLELSVACKYLIPRWKQLSVSIISLISVLVISLVVWLIVVFFSVTEGLENSWIRKLTTLTAPIRVTPTEAYYDSYYHRIDSISEGSDYNLKSIAEKLASTSTDPYDPDIDEEIPMSWPAIERDSNGHVLDLCAEAFKSINQVHGHYPLHATDFEISVSNIKLNLLRSKEQSRDSQAEQKSLSQASYLNSFDPQNPSLERSMLPLETADLNNLLNLIERARGSTHVREQLHRFFDHTEIKSMQFRSSFCELPKSMYPESAKWLGFTVSSGKDLSRVIVPSQVEDLESTMSLLKERGYQTSMVNVQFINGLPSISAIEKDAEEIRLSTPLQVFYPDSFPVKISTESLNTAQRISDVSFAVSIPVQSGTVAGNIPYRLLKINEAHPLENCMTDEASVPYWLHKSENAQGASSLALPSGDSAGEGILLAKHFKDSGVLVGDQGYLSYYAPTNSSVQEQRVPVYVAGFYDPGIIPIGGKFVTANKNITSLIRSSNDVREGGLGNGIAVHFDKLGDADAIKAALSKEFEARGISQYWKIETFKDFDFTRDIIRQLASEKNLFTLIALIVLLVACSNIISMLVILVNDKRLEIGILRAMGATSLQIATIFGLCGAVMGLLGSSIGTLAAILTLRHLDGLLALLSRLQGYDVFNQLFYGDTLPSQLSVEALTFVLCTTVFLSIFAGVVPAVKASLVRPSSILRSDA